MNRSATRGGVPRNCFDSIGRNFSIHKGAQIRSSVFFVHLLRRRGKGIFGTLLTVKGEDPFT